MTWVQWAQHSCHYLEIVEQRRHLPANCSQLRRYSNTLSWNLQISGFEFRNFCGYFNVYFHRWMIIWVSSTSLISECIKMNLQSMAVIKYVNPDTLHNYRYSSRWHIPMFTRRLSLPFGTVVPEEQILKGGRFQLAFFLIQFSRIQSSVGWCGFKGWIHLKAITIHLRSSRCSQLQYSIN